MDKKRRLLVTVAALVVVVLGAWWWRGAAREPLEVWVETVGRGPVEASVSNTRAGTVKACLRSRLSMPIGGTVDRLLVEEGDSVTQGQLLLELWNRDRKADLAQAEQTWLAMQHERQRACLLAKFLRRRAERTQRLMVKELTSEETVDNAVTEADSQQRACDAAVDQEGVAQARMQLQRAILERTQLRAPFAGVVAQINGDVGEYITPSPPGIPTPPAVDLIDYSCLYITAPIDEVDVGSLHVGLPARVTLDAFRDREFSGEVMRIAPYVLELEKQARTVDVDVHLDNVPADVTLLVGYSADITVVLERRERTLRIPTEALLQDDQVWLLDRSSGALTRRALRIGIGNWTHTEVLGGLAEGDRVVRSPDQPGIEEGVLAVAIDD